MKLQRSANNDDDDDDDNDYLYVVDKLWSSDAGCPSLCNDDRSLWKDRSQTRTDWSLSGSPQQACCCC